MYFTIHMSAHTHTPRLHRRCSSGRFETTKAGAKKYPGACAQKYHSAIQIVMGCLLGWDTKKQRGTVGILGIVEAFCQAIEEQGRGTLHRHFLVWIKGFALMRSMIYSKDSC